ncbi:MAG TPA: 4Fe-4S dicluster domain-containing protein, partial [Bacillota bacterium]|nr:4Fe-4S dicluster domain-containing protein [Bacillota bacterium]
VYFNWKTHKAEKCTFCFPKIENGEPTICSETCVGRLRYIGIVLYDADKVLEAASVENEQDLYEAQLDTFLDPFDPDIQKEALKQGIPQDWIEAAQRSPVYKLAVEQKIALPLHPEYRTLPMVWYIPPLSPFMNALGGQVNTLSPEVIFPTINQFRIPIDYLASLFTAGDSNVIKRVLKKLVAMRTYMRYKQLDKSYDTSLLENAGLTEQMAEEMYELSAIAKYEDRYVIPKSHREEAGNMFNYQGSAGFEFMEACRSCFGGSEQETNPLDFYESGFWEDWDEQTAKDI